MDKHRDKKIKPRQEPWLELKPCYADFTLHCCGDTTTYGSYIDMQLKDGDVLHCRICGKIYKPKVSVETTQIENNMGKSAPYAEDVLIAVFHFAKEKIQKFPASNLQSVWYKLACQYPQLAAVLEFRSRDGGHDSGVLAQAITNLMATNVLVWDTQNNFTITSVVTKTYLEYTKNNMEKSNWLCPQEEIENIVASFVQAVCIDDQPTKR